MADLQALIADLSYEHAALEAVVAPLEPEAWDTLTPAEGWSIRDQVSHLAFFDEQANRAVGDPDGFVAALSEIASDPVGFMDGPLERGRAVTPDELLGWWRAARSDMLAALALLDPGARIPWFGPPMGAASFISARLMETWAHGQDVRDALGLAPEASDRLRHVAFLGWRARPFSYIANGLGAPSGEVGVSLTAPSGEVWEFGESEGDSVTGSALGFCLVVTQRRHLDDTDLVMTGPLATEWMSIAQCFAGPPGSGRAPGQFPPLPRPTS